MTPNKFSTRDIILTIAIALIGVASFYAVFFLFAHPADSLPSAATENIAIKPSKIDKIEVDCRANPNCTHIYYNVFTNDENLKLYNLNYLTKLSISKVCNVEVTGKKDTNSENYRHITKINYCE